jgi:hypothetical protein
MKFLRTVVLLLVTSISGLAMADGETLLVKRAAELRQAPGESASSLAPLPVQTALTRLSARQGPWIQVKTAAGLTGWVHMFDVGTSSTPSSLPSTASGALRGLTNFFNGGNAQAKNNTTATSTVGIRGLGAEDIANAQPNLAALTQAESMRQDATQAKHFAADAAWSPRAVEPLPAPAPPVVPKAPGVGGKNSEF